MVMSILGTGVKNSLRNQKIAFLKSSMFIAVNKNKYNSFKALYDSGFFLDIKRFFKQINIKEDFLSKVNYRDNEGRNVLFIGERCSKVRNIKVLFGNSKVFSKDINDLLENNIPNLTYARYMDKNTYTYHQYNKGKIDREEFDKVENLEFKIPEQYKYSKIEGEDENFSIQKLLENSQKESGRVRFSLYN